MRIIITTLLFILFSFILNAQQREFDIAIGEYIFNIKRDVQTAKSTFDNGIINVCAKVKVHPSNFPDTSKGEKNSTFCTLLNTDNLPIFLKTVTNNIKSITGEEFIKKYEQELKAILETKYLELIKSINYTEFEFGRDVYYGLNDEEISKLEERKSKLNNLYTEYTTKKIFLRSRSKEIREHFNQRKKELEPESNEETEETLKAKITTDSLAKVADPTKAGIQKQNNDYIDSLIKLNRLIRLEKASIKALLVKRKYQVALIGNANSVSSFKTVDQSELNAGFGIRAFKPEHSEFIGILTIAQARDTVHGDIEDFGESVLIPGVRRFSLLTSYRLNSFNTLARLPFLRKWGGAVTINVTPYNWLLKKESNPSQDSVISKVIPSSIDLLLSYNWLSLYEEGKDISISTDIGFTGRILAGNLDKEERKVFLGRETKFYAGINLGLNIRYNGLRVQFYAPFIIGKQVKGLTGGQVYASIGFIGSIINSATSIIKNKKNEVSNGF